MSAKKSKEPTPKASTASKKPISANDQLPGLLELDFRRLLGRHNLHLNMLDVSARIFADTLAKQPSEEKYFRECAKKLGFHSLYPDTSFASARTYLVYSHLAYVFSAGDQLCERVRSTRSMKALKADTPFFNEIDKGDFVTKTVALTVLTTMPPESRGVDEVNSRVANILNLEPFALVNYYRLIRNEELHASGEADRRAAAVRSALPLDRIKALYGTTPSSAGELTSSDALLCSKAWQNVAKWLCRHVLSDSEGQAILKMRFSRLKETRRADAAKKFMKLELLYSENEIDATMAAIHW